ncbi:MAG: cache domain-containing protein [Campylobacterota bacterium]|nr:cache domain-containing protein [Campylobacterota bacterium]
MSKMIKIGAALALTMTMSFGETKADAKAHVEAGVEHCKAVGIAQCIKDFQKPASKWVKGTLYIWSNDLDGVITAHPIKPKLVGKNLNKLKDKNGVALFAEFNKMVKANGEGWVGYVWAHPVSKKPADKHSFVKGIGENQLIGCGVYINDEAK